MSKAADDIEASSTELADAALASIGQASPAPEDPDDEEAVKAAKTPAVALDDPVRVQILTRLALLNAVELLILVVVFVSCRAPFADYNVGTGVVDLVLLDSVRAATVLGSICLRSATAVYVAHAVNSLWLISPLTAKFWVFTAWFDPPLFTLVVILCPLVALLTFDGTWRVTSMDVPGGENSLRLHSMITILRPYFRPRGTANQVMVIVTWVMLALGKAAGIVSPIFLGRAVSKLSSDPMQPPYKDIGIFIALQFVPRLTTEIQDTLYVRVWQIAFIEAAETTFRHLHSLSLDWHLRKKMGNALRSMDRGLEAADSLMSYCLLNFLPALVSAFVSFALFAFHFKVREVAAVCHAGLAIYCWVTYALTVWRQKLGEETNVHDNDMHEKATDSLINFETVKYFGNEDYEARRYVQCVREYQRTTYRSQWATSALNVTQSAAINLTLLGALLLAARVTMMKVPGFGPGEFVAIQAYVFNVFSPLSYLGYLYTAVISALVNMQNLCDLLNEKADIVDDDGAPPLVLKLATSNVIAIPGNQGPVSIPDSTVVFDHVTFRYPSQQPTQGLHDISFSIPAGTTTAVVGETGSGKTTLSRLLFRFYDVLDGGITIGGQDIRNVTQRSLRQVVGMVPQDTCMFHESIRYNLAYGKPEATEEELRDVASKARILQFIESLSEKWNTVVGERGLKLSGGEKQRVAIARCLLKNPPIVILDEATSALDNATELEVQAALRSLAGRTTLIIAHRLTTIQHADQIIVMKKGRIVERGTHEGLLATPNSEYAMLWRAQRLHEASVKDVCKELPLRAE